MMVNKCLITGVNFWTATSTILSHSSYQSGSLATNALVSGGYMLCCNQFFIAAWNIEDCQLAMPNQLGITINCVFVFQHVWIFPNIWDDTLTFADLFQRASSTYLTAARFASSRSHQLPLVASMAAAMRAARIGKTPWPDVHVAPMMQVTAALQAVTSSDAR